MKQSRYSWLYVASFTYAPIPLGYDLFPTLPTSTDLGTYAQAATIGSNRQEYTVSTFWLCCSHARYAVNTIEIRLIHDVQSRNSRFRYVLHTLIQDPKPITTDTMTMYLRWRRPWYDLVRFSYAHADQLTFWIRLWRADRRYLSRTHKHIRRPLPIPIVLAHRHHGSSIRCPALGSYSETACQSRATAGLPRGWQKKNPRLFPEISLTTNKFQSLSRYIPCGDFCDIFKTTKKSHYSSTDAST